MSNSSVSNMLCRNELASWTERQTNDTESQTDGALTIKAYAENASAMRGNASNSLSDEKNTRKN